MSTPDIQSHGNVGIISSPAITSTLGFRYLPLALKNHTNLDEGKIVFVSTLDTSDEIYSMSYDGSGVARLTNTTSLNHSPDWSPDGSKIAFTSDRNGVFDVYVMNADGSNQTELTFLGSCSSPKWSPDGTKIAFIGPNELSEPIIYTVDPDGNNLAPLTDSTTAPGDLTWSPDGLKIAFSSPNPEAGIYTVDRDGTNLTLLVPVTNLGFIEWSPDGSTIVISRAEPPQLNSDLYLYRISSGDITRITNTNVNHLSVSWSPTGRHIIFHSTLTFDPVNFEIYSITPDGGNLLDLTNNPAADSEADWTK